MSFASCSLRLLKEDREKERQKRVPVCLGRSLFAGGYFCLVCEFEKLAISTRNLQTFVLRDTTQKCVCKLLNACLELQGSDFTFSVEASCKYLTVARLNSR